MVSDPGTSRIGKIYTLRMKSRIAVAETEEQIHECFAIMNELRPHLTPESFLSQVQRQRRHGYRLTYIESEGSVHAVAGYRISECLAWGRFLYVDDLVTRSGDRSKGFGAMLLQWLLREADRNGCGQVHLDSGVQRHDAHRFYLNNNFRITSHHFALLLPGEVPATR